MTNHRRFQMLAAGALDFRSSAADDRELATHLASCPECRGFAAGLRADAALARELPKVHAPDLVRDVVVAAVLRGEPAVGLRPVLRMVGWALVATVLLAGLAWVNRSTIEGPGRLPVRTWVRLADTSAFDGGQVSAVLRGGPGLVAVGSASENGGEAAVWTSGDGSSWTRAASTPSFAGLSMASIASNGSTLVAGGLGLFWVSTDGRTWTASAPISTYALGCQIYGALIPGGPGLVAVGTDKCDSSGSADRVVTSTDGLTWSEVPATAFTGAKVSGVAAGSAGLVAVGTASRGPAVWTSSDGRAWTRVPAAQTPASGRMMDVAVGGHGFVAVGSDGGRGAAWTSTDGRTWQEQPPSAALDGASMTRVHSTGAGLIALGESSTGDGLAWVSSDGSSWTRLDTGGLFAKSRILAFETLGSRWMLFGEDDSSRVIVAVSDR